MECQELEVAMAEYLAGTPNPAVEAHLATCAACRETVALWNQLEVMPMEVAPAAGFAARFRQKLRGRPMISGHWLAAAAALLVGVLSFLGGRMSAGGASSDLVSLHREVRNLREVVTLSLLDQQSASERLRGIRYSTAIEGSDPEVVAALTRTLTTDSSVDVRLAAADALRRFSLQGPVLESAWQLLDRDESPLVQIAVIDLLSSSRDASVRARLEKLRGNAGLNPAVRDYLQAVLSNQRNRGQQYQ